jgi:hypothetical protein
VPAASSARSGAASSATTCEPSVAASSVSFVVTGARALMPLAPANCTVVGEPGSIAASAVPCRTSSAATRSDRTALNDHWPGAASSAARFSPAISAPGATTTRASCGLGCGWRPC